MSLPSGAHQIPKQKAWHDYNKQGKPHKTTELVIQGRVLGDKGQMMINQNILKAKQNKTTTTQTKTNKTETKMPSKVSKRANTEHKPSRLNPECF